MVTVGAIRSIEVDGEIRIESIIVVDRFSRFSEPELTTPLSNE